MEDFLAVFLKKDPNERIALVEAKSHSFVRHNIHSTPSEDGSRDRISSLGGPVQLVEGDVEDAITSHLQFVMAARLSVALKRWLKRARKRIEERNISLQRSLEVNLEQGEEELEDQEGDSFDFEDTDQYEEEGDQGDQQPERDENDNNSEKKVRGYCHWGRSSSGESNCVVQ